MVMDAAKAGDTWILKGSRGFSTWDGQADGRSQKADIPYPQLEGVPFDRFMADLHNGMVFHHHFVWVNDLVCVIAILLCITGFIAWWRKKWV